MTCSSTDTPCCRCARCLSPSTRRPPQCAKHWRMSRMSIHMIGRHYSLVPEGGVTSLLELQNDLAIERAP